MAGCCKHDGSEIAARGRRMRIALVLVIAINATMFVVEVVAGQLAGSQALLADALDFLGDAATYAISLVALGMTALWRARVAMLKGVTLALLGAYVLASTVWRVSSGTVPEAEVMGWVGILALGANMLSVLLLLGFRDGDANIRSVWLCSRNDAIGNVAVVLAALGVFGTGTAWPDLLVAAAMASLFAWSAFGIISQARGEVSDLRRAALVAD